MSALPRFFIAIFLSCSTLASGDDSVYLDLKDPGVMAPTLGSNPLPMSRYPTTLDIAFSRQHAHLRTVDVSGKVWQWQLRPPPKPELIASTKHEPACAALSSDGELLAYSDFDQKLTLLHLNSSETRLEEFYSDAKLVAIEFSADNKFLASVTNEGVINIWNVASGAKVDEFRSEAGDIQFIAFSPNGKILAVSASSHVVRFFSIGVQQSELKLRRISVQNSRVTAIQFSPDSQQIVVASANGTAKVHQLDQSKKWIDLDSHPFAIWSISFDAEGRRMVVGSWDGLIRVWDTQTWRLSQQLKGHEESVSRMLINELGMVSSGLDGRLLYWPLKVAGTEPIAMISGNKAPVWVCTYSPDSRRMFLGGSEKRFEMWDLEEQQKSYFREGAPTTRCAAFSHDGIKLAVGRDDHTVALYETDDANLLHMLKGHMGPISIVFFSDEGQTLISGCDRGILKFWDTNTGQETASLRRHKQQLYCASISPDEKLLVTGGGHWLKQNPGELIVWDLQKRRVKTQLKGHTRTVWSIVFTPDGKYLLTADNAGDVIVWDTKTFRQARTLKHGNWIRPLAISPDGKTLAVGRGDGSIRQWDTAKWVEKTPLDGHESFTFWLEYAPDGKTLASASDDGTVRFWSSH